MAECNQSTDCFGSQVCWVVSSRFETIGNITYRWKYDGICGARPSGSLGTWDRGYRIDTEGGTCELYGYGYSPAVIEQASIPSTFKCGNGYSVPYIERCVPQNYGSFIYDRLCAGVWINGVFVKSFVEP